VWTKTVVVTVEPGYAGPLTNTVQVTTLEGAVGAYTQVSTAVLEWYSLYLPLLLKTP
jgi:fluoride ion exporter CrcB/FEX